MTLRSSCQRRAATTSRGESIGFAVGLIFALVSPVGAADRSSLNVDITARRNPIGVSVLMKNPAGLRTGEDVNSGLQIQEIPDSDTSHGGPSDDVTGEAGAQSMAISVRRPMAGVYDLTVVSSTETHYFLGIYGADSSHARFNREVEGIISPARPQGFSIDYSPVPGAVISIRPTFPDAFLGADVISSCGRISIDGDSRVSGSVRANGTIAVTGNAVVTGDASGATISASKPTSIGGVNTVAARPVSCVQGETSSMVTLSSADNNNAVIPGRFMNGGNLSLKAKDELTLPGGVYVFDQVELAGDSRVTTSGSARVIIRKNLSMSGQAAVGSRANHPIIIGSAAGTISMTGGSEMFADVYAPDASIGVNGSAHFVGHALVSEASIAGKVRIETP